MRALRDFNIPKIVTDDLPVFMGLIGDLFPALDVPRKRDLSFEKVTQRAGGEGRGEAEGVGGISARSPPGHQAVGAGAEAAGGGELCAEGGAAGGAAAGAALRLRHRQRRLWQIPGSSQTQPGGAGSWEKGCRALQELPPALQQSHPVGAEVTQQDVPQHEAEASHCGPRPEGCDL